MESKQENVQGLIRVTRDKLLKAGYTTLGLPERVWRNLDSYMSQKGLTHFSEEIGMQFLEERYSFSANPLSNSNMDRLRAIQLLVDCQAQQPISVRRSRQGGEIAEAFTLVFTAFLDYERNKGLSERTMGSHLLYLRRFSWYLAERNISQLMEITVSHVYEFIQFSASSRSKSTVYCTACLLRTLFRFLFDQELISENLALTVPRVKCSKKARIPSAYSQEEIEQVLACVDRGNPKGKRDYAMLLMATRLGMRASDICGLTFENFKWESDTIEWRQGKTDKWVVLPLLTDVGEAVIDYLKYGRPPVDAKEIFLRLSAPIGPMKAPTLHSVVTYYMRKANIPIPEGKKHGPHALRHSLASALLRNRTPMPVISEVLGHTSTDTTAVYLKIDILQLHEYALPVPPLEVWRGGGMA